MRGAGGLLLPTVAAMLLVPAVASAQRAAGAQQLPRAHPNDHRTPAGHIVDGELRIELEAVEAEWYPRGADGPRVVTPAFAELGGPPQVPGPLIRASAGTPVHVTIRNTLDRPIAVRGLLDRASLGSGDAPPGPGPFPAFAFAEPLVVPPGETRESRFTATADVSSFYYGLRLPPGSGAEAAPPFGRVQEGAFMGALVVDALGSPGPSEERVLMITRWSSFTEGPTQKVMANGLSWPFTERLKYTVGDTVRWRVINASNLDHPMHLHGFYFTVDALGDTQADTAYAPGARPVAVTQMMEEFSAMRLTWVPEQPGNWLFHCHLVRHMAFPQRFASEGPPGPAAHEAHDGHRMDNMAGLITGITVHPAAGAEETEEAPVRRIDLWTGERPDVYDGDPELGFVVQEGTEPPAPDSTRVPGSPLVLTRGEPTEIVVHNRLDFPLSVHWHGLELRSVYDGVGGWSGYPGAVRPPIASGDSVRVLITPPRAGSFMYHIHGEPGHELSQGLYGPFLVLEPGEERDRDADRVYTLAARGATADGAPAINGRTRPDPQRFQPGRSYRLRFLQISADAFKRVRLLRDGEPVRWRPLAKDGAELPEAARALRPASIGIGVGETYDVVWRPEEPGVYVLEVTTEFFPALGGTVVQRVAFGVGDVAEAELLRAQEPALPVAALSPAERARYVGTFVGPQVVGGDGELVLSVWEAQERLYATLLLPVAWDDDGAPERLFPVGDGRLAPGRDLDGLQHLLGERYRFREAPEGGLDHLDAEVGGQVVAKLARVPYLELDESRLRRFEGTYGTPGEAGRATVALDDGVLTLAREGGPSERLVPISSTRFAVEGESGMRVDFELDEGRAGGLTIVSPTGARTQLPAADSDTVRVAPGTTTRHPELGEVAYESKFVQVRGIRMHYVDFGGSGLPVIFIHGSHGNARSFVDFAPRFADAFRVLALDRRGFGESEDVDWGHGTAAQAEDVLGFMDALGLERAVLIGNVAGPTGLMVYLGEHHPDRLAGMVYLAHMGPDVPARRHPAVAEFWDMGFRNACDWDEETRRRVTESARYRPHFVDDPDFRIDVPALSFANAEGTRYPADFDFVGFLLQSVETGEWCDPTAKAYFAALAADTARADELRNRLGDLSGAANLGTFERAFGPRMTIVRLSVPAVSGYEYQEAPDLIYPHIRTFLEGLNEPEQDGGEP